MAFSVVFHALATLCLVFIHFPANSPERRLERKHPSTELRIGDKLYYVSRLALPERRVIVQSPGRSAPRRSSLGAQAAPPAERPAPRMFIPPEVKRNAVVEQTLIQPASPPEIVPPEMNLPTFKTWTAQIPKIPKQFIAPGREVKPQVEPQPPITPPSLNLIAANPAPSKSNPSLIVPLPPPPIELPDIPVASSDVALPGDPAAIISVSRNPVLPGSTLVVPAGNIAGIVGKDTGSGVPGATGYGTSSAVGKGNGPGNGSVPGNGSGAGNSTGNDKGSSALSAGVGSGTEGSGAGKPKIVVLTRPRNGSFDAVVVQSSGLDLLPGRKDLLSGRPIYTVYLAVGTAKDWTFYFCARQDPAARNISPNVVSLAPVAPVDAPFPVRMVRPLVALPSYQKYLLVHGFVTDAGRVERLRVIEHGVDSVDDAILSSLIDWEFRPATRDGQPIPVEFLLAIPQAGLGI